jgi:hypothetical protein
VERAVFATKSHTPGVVCQVARDGHAVLSCRLQMPVGRTVTYLAEEDTLAYAAMGCRTVAVVPAACAGD